MAVPVEPVVKTFDVIILEEVFVTPKVVLPFAKGPAAVVVNEEPSEVKTAARVELPDAPVADDVPVPKMVATFA